MKKIKIYQSAKRCLFVLISLCVLLGLCVKLTVKAGIENDWPKEDDIQPEIIYYDYVDDKGVLKGGAIKVYADSPLHSKYKGPERVILDFYPSYDVYTLIDNGPTENRLDLVFVGDGYQEDDLDDYASHVDTVIAGFFSQSPFDEYASFFNLHRVDVISTDWGVRYGYEEGCDDPYVPDTALKMQFCSEWLPGKILQRLLTIGDTAAADAAAGLAPDSDFIMALANSWKHGGSGGTYICLSGGHEDKAETALHEFGHSFGNLGDEYFDEDSGSYPGTEEGLEANLSTYEAEDMNDESRKWYRWLDWGPEPKDVWTREGGRYYEFDIYRPTWWSMMRDLDYPFYQVNTEQLIFKIYEMVNPIDYATPEGTYAIGTQFFVQPVKPATHSLDVTWYRVGDPDPVGTGPEFDSSTLDLPTGEYTLQVKVVDNTGMVKNETARNDYMTEWREWTLGKAAHWKLDESTGDTAEDTIGSNDGTLVGDPTWLPSGGKVDGALLFDGDGDYIEVSNPDDLNFGDSTDFTFSAWIKAETTQLTYPAIIGRRNASPYKGYIFFLWSDGKLAVQLNDGTATDYVSTSGDLRDGAWHHVVATADREDYLTFYVDGQQKGQNDISAKGNIDSTSNLFIGWEERDPTNSYFNGTIDDVRVYHWKINQAQIWEIMYPGTSKFSVTDNSRVLMAWFDDLGNLFLRGSLEQGDKNPPSITYNDGFKFKNPSDANLAMIDGTNGNMYIYDSKKNWNTPSAGKDEFIIGNSEDEPVAYISEAGNLYLKGDLYENPD